MPSHRKLPTYHMLVVIGVLLHRKTYGQVIINETGIRAGTLYPLLKNLKSAGIVVQERERGDPKLLRRPLRIYYGLTDKGRRFGAMYNTRMLSSDPRLVPFDEFE